MVTNRLLKAETKIITAIKQNFMTNSNENNNFSAPFWQLGFRPFFFIAGVFAVVLMGVWLLFYQGVLGVANVSGGNWHGHEMIFGY